ncbi:hypothetical protein H4J57_14920 [Colwellia sp. BRX8-7]|jgi:hypothetical protein|nr:hypothetical protein [Colwellia sp. BRX8-7]MBA6338485.1 hypothetical protein [Colwellia sp. BRX8-7]
MQSIIIEQALALFIDVNVTSDIINRHLAQSTGSPELASGAYVKRL